MKPACGVTLEVVEEEETSQLQITYMVGEHRARLIIYVDQPESAPNFLKVFNKIKTDIQR